jgi:hypothetical protein
MCRLNFPLDQTGCEFDGSERISYLVRKSGGHLPERCKAILELLPLVQLLHQCEILKNSETPSTALIIFGEGNGMPTVRIFPSRNLKPALRGWGDSSSGRHR